MAAIDDDDGAPEVVTLDEGREEAEKFRREEKESKKRVASEMKQLRKARSEKKNPGVESEGTEVANLRMRPGRTKRRIRDTDSGDRAEKQDIGSVMLDDSVVQLLRVREQEQVAKGVSPASHKYIVEKKVKKGPKLESEIATDSRTRIVSLKREPNAAATTKAIDFRQEHFYGQHRKRSTTMISTGSRCFTASV